MKKRIIEHYAVIMLLSFVIYNFFFVHLKIYGPLYQVYMIVLILVHASILIIFRKNIKYKLLVIMAYLLIWLFSKNALQCFFALSSIVILCITGSMEKRIIKVFSIVLAGVFCIISLPLFFAFLLIFGTGLDEERDVHDIYENTHYRCENHYEIYAYSLGAMDDFHYSIGKYHEILNINGIINISYSERNEKTYEQYESYRKTHQCELVSKKNGSQ